MSVKSSCYYFDQKKLGFYCSESERVCILKLRQCCVFNDLKWLPMKSEILQELVDYVTSPGFKFAKVLYPEIIHLFKVNFFEDKPKASNEQDFYIYKHGAAVESGAITRFSQVRNIHMLFLCLLETPGFRRDVAKIYLDEAFVMKMLKLFKSPNAHQRYYVKLIVFQIYLKLASMRMFIQKQFVNIFCEFIYEKEEHDGIPEILEIITAMIERFARPLREEHKELLLRALLILYRGRTLADYQNNLSNCLGQFIEKEPTLAVTIVKCVLKNWPKKSPRREELFLNELEHMLNIIGMEEAKNVARSVFTRIIQSLNSSFAAVFVRAFHFFDNSRIMTIIAKNAGLVFPIIVPGLRRALRLRASALAQWRIKKALHSLRVMNCYVYDQCSDARVEERERWRKIISADKWRRVEELAKRNVAAAAKSKDVEKFQKF